jgi:hypothetical protein
MLVRFLGIPALTVAILAGSVPLAGAQTTTTPAAGDTTTTTTAPVRTDRGFDWGWLGLLGLIGLAGLGRNRRDTTVRTTTTSPRI